MNQSQIKSFGFPGNIEPEILAIAAGQVPYMRTEWFSRLYLDIERMMLELVDCSNGRLIPLTAAGTAAMESCVTSLTTASSRALVVNGGTFGDRWAEICHYHSVPFDELKVPFGRDLDWEQLESMLATGRHDVLFMQHHETSSGFLYDIRRISFLCKEHNVLFVVDAISSFLTDPLSMKEDGVDALVLSSHKGLNIPPGLSFVILAPELARREEFANGAYYGDWKNALTNGVRGQTPWSPATHLFMQLHHRLVSTMEQGLHAVLTGVRDKACAFRKACDQKKWTMLPERSSNCISSILLPRNVGELVNELIKQDVYVMPSREPNQLRVAHVGTLTVQDHLDLVDKIAHWVESH